MGDSYFRIRSLKIGIMICAFVFIDKLFSKTPSEDLNDSLHELSDNGFLYDIPIHDVTHKYELSNHAIATLETIPKEAILSLAKFIPNFFL